MDPAFLSRTGLSQLAGEQLSPRSKRSLGTLSFISKYLPSPLACLRVLLDSRLQSSHLSKRAKQVLLLVLLPGSGQTEQWVGTLGVKALAESQSSHPVCGIVNRHNYYYWERWARGGQGHGWGEWNEKVLGMCRLARLILLPVGLTAARLITQASPLFITRSVELISGCRPI